jgi:hypothetical protein
MAQTQLLIVCRTAKCAIRKIDQNSRPSQLAKARQLTKAEGENQRGPENNEM